MKTSILLVLCLICLLFFTGCGTTGTSQPKVITEVKTVTVKVPVIYPVPDIKCEFKGRGMTTVAKLLDCIVLQKRVLNDIREFNKRAEEEYKKSLNKQ